MGKLLTIFFLLGSLRGISQQPIFATISGGDLYSFDLTNCTRHFIGSTGQGFGDIALTPDGRLWGIISGNLYHIDTTTANATLIGSMGVQCVSLVGLNDTTLFVESGLKLYGVNNNTAASYYIDTIGFQAAGDLTWYDDDLYMVTSAGKIIRMELNNTYTDIISVTPIGSSVPSCEGAVAASFIGDYNSIVGFNGPNLIKICQIDGSSQMLCPNLNIGGTPGGASIRLATQVPQPTSCTITGIQYVLPNNLFSIFPNPATSELNIQTSSNQKFRFTIYNTLGQLVTTGIVESSSTTIDINNLSNGVYSVEISGGHKTERKCFIVERLGSR